MRYFGGNVFRDGSLEQGYIGVDGELIKEFTSEPPRDAEEVHHGTILPLLTNFHTHIGDSSVGVPSNLSFEDIIRAPNGFKHKALASIDRDTLIEGMQRSIRTMSKCGVRHFLDFREGGIEGIGLLRRAQEGQDTPIPTYSAFGRPGTLTYEPEELDTLLKDVDGLGLSGIGDWDYDTLLQVAEHTHECGRLFAIHASELRREPVDRLLDLEPDLLVHMTKATEDDLQAVAQQGIPVVVCPRNNLLAGNRVNIPAIVESGIDVYLGTDNAMFNPPSPLQELECACRISKDFGTLAPQTLISMITGTGKKVLNRWGGITLDPGNFADFLYLRFPADLEPYEAICEGLGDGSIQAVYFRGRPVSGKRGSTSQKEART